ncbi:NERD domain-containing protein [Stieleria sp. TO1_6]|uniref:NERD domain-containing protein n=1 Tax=Stieleria tagensis TaxID=2956795 RepID=UPI00209B8E8A|nr:NERD domain-containing protein/DEAD/DEAH box helicase [Stieleria tagensis]MCO8122592.1 NERD domain-containing protein [Stieleria tagensis]
MATMIPKVDPATISYESERLLYIALRDNVSNDFVCFHSYPWLRPDRDLTLREGETDFVVLHQELGMLVLEAKGGQIDYQAPLWKRRKKTYWETIQNPFEQAKRNMHKLNEIIGERTDGEVLTQHYVYGFAAAFPTHDYLGPVPTNSDPSIIIAAPHLPDLQQKIEGAFRSWTRHQRPLSDSSWTKLVNALLPHFRLFRPVNVNLRSDYDQIKELTDGQLSFFRSLGANRLYVEGVAGSGKTLLALDRARTFAKDGRRTLLVCFNKELAAWWNEQFEQSEIDRPCLSHLEITHFHSLAARLAKQAEIDFKPPSAKQESEVFWRDEVPEIIEQAALVLMDEPEFQYDAIVLDEGQDFHTTWWDCLNYCLLKGESKGTFYAFCDPNQSLWDWSMAKPNIPFDAPVTLRHNCRNTQAIARSSSVLASVTSEVLDRSPVGLKPDISRPSSIESGKGVVQQIVRDLLTKHNVSPSEIVIIGPRGLVAGSLKDVAAIEGIPLIDSAEKWRVKEGLLVTTARSFKGLESDAVVIYDVGPLGGTFDLTDLYVACTRARTYLHIVVYDPNSSKRIQEAINTGWNRATGGNT